MLDRDLNASYNIETKAFGTSQWLDRAMEKFRNGDVVIPELRFLSNNGINNADSSEKNNQVVILDVIGNISSVLN